MKNKILIKKIPADRFTPLVVFKKLDSRALLESAVLEIGKSRYSIILVDEAFRLILRGEHIIKQQNGTQKILSRNPHRFLDYLKFESTALMSSKNYGIPIPACGIGYLGYEAATLFDTIRLNPQKDELKIPDAIFLFGASFVVFDHYKDELNIVAVAHDSQEQAQQRIDEIVARLLDDDFRAYRQNEQVYDCEADLKTDRDEFLGGVEKLKNEIVSGNIVQAVLSRRMALRTDLPPIDAYSRLRRENPSPYLFYFNFGEFELLGASPELMVSLSNGLATIKPIAGTRPRGKDRTEDLEMEKELLADAKERAEHLMLVDLARNDLGRIAVAGSVEPRNLFFVERYSQVMHIVSQIEAKMRPDKNVYDLIRATFPAGTVSGAPKIKAMELVSALERIKRGPYAGLIGHFDINGEFDSCITIRSYIHKENTYYIQAGAGIVYDSVPEKEFDETMQKAKALIRALGINL